MTFNDDLQGLTLMTLDYEGQSQSSTEIVAVSVNDGVKK